MVLSPSFKCALNSLNFISKMPIQEAISKSIDNHREQLTFHDKHLCSELVYGIIRSQIRLDFVINKFIKKTKSLSSFFKNHLYLGIYSLLFLDGIPDYAIINSIVEAIKIKFGTKLANLSNAFLRNVQRELKDILELDFYKSDNSNIITYSIFYSMPITIAQMWSSNYGEDLAINLMKRSFSRPYTGIRINGNSDISKGIISEFLKHGHCYDLGNYGIAIESGYMPESILNKNISELQNEGIISYQAAGSQIILKELDIYNDKLPIWDLCAGIGGKTFALLENNCHVKLATDISKYRLKLLKDRIIKYNYKDPFCLILDGLQLPIREWRGSVVLDVPCSGLGVLSRRPDIKLKVIKDKKHLLRFINIQRSILDNISNIIHSGSYLYYITCTLNPCENEEAIYAFLHKRPQFKLICSYHTPHEHSWLEGMYGAKLQKI